MRGSHQARAVSVTPGRIRVRVERGPGSGADLVALSEALEPIPEIDDIRLRPHSSSAIIGFDPRNIAAVHEQLSDLGIQMPRENPAAPADPVTSIRTAAGLINQEVTKRVPGGDLRLLIPIALGLMSVRQVVRGEERLKDAPWYLLAWYASESFFKLQQADSSAGRSADQDG